MSNLYIGITHAEAIVLARGILGQLAFHDSNPSISDGKVYISVDEMNDGSVRVTAA